MLQQEFEELSYVLLGTGKMLHATASLVVRGCSTFTMIKIAYLQKSLLKSSSIFRFLFVRLLLHVVKKNFP
jgi:hypothetical protein